jgi:DNA-binding CsgD family transcriptional regulator
MSIPSTSSCCPKRHLTRREREVLALIANGYSTADVARVLWITEDTVRTHIRRMKARLEARSRPHLVAIAFREGLWTDDRARRDWGEDA